MADKNIVLAVVGLPGAGKSEASEYVAKKTSWPKVHFGVLPEHLIEKGLEVTEANERKLREDMRAEHGMGAFAILNLPKIKEWYQTSSAIVESLYSWEEYLTLKQEFGDAFKVLAVYASPAVRQQRLLNRPIRPLTPEEFVSRDYSQIENLHQAGPIARADFTVFNEGTIEKLYSQIDEVLNKLNV